MADRKDYLTVGVLALQGAFKEHLQLLREAAQRLSSSFSSASASSDVDAGADKTTTTTRWKKRAAGVEWRFIEVRTAAELARCDALIIPGGESTTMSLVAARSGLLEPLREVSRKPVWGTCAGLIILAETANRTKKGGQDLIGGLDVSVARNHFGRQVESFVADLQLPFLLRDYNGADGGSDAGRQTDDSQTGGTSATKAAATTPPPPPPASSFRGIFIRAPVVERILRPQENAERGEDGEARPGADADGRRRRRSGGEHMNGVEGKKEAKKEEEEEEEEGRGVVHAPPRQPKDAAASELARESVEVLATLPGRTQRQQPPPPPPNNGQGDQVRAHDGDVIAVKQGNVFGTSFHPELSGDARIHLWWLEEALKLIERQESSHGEE